MRLLYRHGISAKLVVILSVTSLLLLIGYLYFADLRYNIIAGASGNVRIREYFLGKYHGDLYRRNVLDMERNPTLIKHESLGTNGSGKGGDRGKETTTTSEPMTPEERTKNVKRSLRNIPNGNKAVTSDLLHVRGQRMTNTTVRGINDVISSEDEIDGSSLSVTDKTLTGRVKRSDIEYPGQVLNGTNWMSFLDTMTSLPRGVISFLGEFRINENVPMKVEKPMVSFVEVVNHYWQLVAADTEIYLYSAYYDDRPTLDEPMVRIIAVAQVNTGTLFCLYWYNEQKNPDIAIVEIDAIGPKISPSDGVKYEQYLFSCALVDGKGPPETVSVISTSELNPSTLLTVQIPEKPHKKIEFGHCMSVVYWKHDPYKVVEWLELHRMFGVGEVTVYNNSLDNITSYIFQKYARDGFVDFRQAPSILSDNKELTILLNMSPVINDCMYRNMYRYRWIVCTDLDEMLVPRKHMTYSRLLKSLNRQRHRPANSYMFSNVYFFTDLGPVSREPWFLVTQRYLRHVTPSKFGYSVKSITDPLSCIGLQNHVCWRRVKSLENDTLGWNIHVNTSLAMNYHYKKCHLDEFESTFGQCTDLMRGQRVDKTLRKFGRKLYKRVVSKLLDLGLIEEDGDEKKTDEKA